ncbi:MAG TPA: acylphosphatase [Povalibacter sp.]|uniref:acylphosphatase n=1 Tax=Povalibacter sp. TaxID=1962978 RepID=UPI002B9896F2|nr:acylphosphatase [Povalibacter sp.]HMN43463.1 acylphosphatase [Povalibacter sp.]
MPVLVARRCFVSGRVQGVFYRGSTRQKAIELGLSGYARNLPDGRVEVLAVGDATAVVSLIDWLAIGPPAAHVSNVDVIELDLDAIDDVPVGFATR